MRLHYPPTAGLRHHRAIDGTVLEDAGRRCSARSGGDRQVRVAPCTWAADGTSTDPPDESCVPAQRAPAAVTAG